MAVKESVGEGMSNRGAAEIQMKLAEEGIPSTITEYESQYWVLVRPEDKERAMRAAGL